MKLKKFVASQTAALNNGKLLQVIAAPEIVLEKPLTAKRLVKIKALAGALNTVVLFDRDDNVLVFARQNCVGQHVPA